MAKKKISSDDKKAIKITAIFVFLFVVATGMYLLFNAQEKKPAPVKPKVKHYAVKPTPVPVATVPVKPIKKTTVPSQVVIPSGKGIKIAFVFDDWGYRMSNCHFLKEIKVPFAIAVLPNLRYTDDIMKCASIHNKDIMLHLPLEPYSNPDPYPDNYLITTKMPLNKVGVLLDGTLKKMPMIIGVNNHMGSRATEDKALMRFIMKRLKKNNLFFVDSVTAPHSVCNEIANEVKIPFGQRDVFLDNVNTRAAIEKQFVELAQKARHKGYAIAIGHDRALTMEVFKDMVPILQKQGFEIVSVKDLLRNKSK